MTRRNEKPPADGRGPGGAAARAPAASFGWVHVGRSRPPFADEPGEGEESVWDYPRPPVLVPDSRRVRVRLGQEVLADTRRAVRVLETASPPTFYLPPDDVREDLLRSAGGGSFCEWKGAARYWEAEVEGTAVRRGIWSYPEPTDAFASIAGWYAFYPDRFECTVDGERVRAQLGGFYGGWVTGEIVGPYKGDPGTGGW